MMRLPLIASILLACSSSPKPGPEPAAPPTPLVGSTAPEQPAPVPTTTSEWSLARPPVGDERRHGRRRRRMTTVLDVLENGRGPHVARRSRSRKTGRSRR
jgi:hypothetical protein